MRTFDIYMVLYAFVQVCRWFIHLTTQLLNCLKEMGECSEMDLDSFSAG